MSFGPPCASMASRGEPVDVADLAREGVRREAIARGMLDAGRPSLPAFVARSPGLDEPRHLRDLTSVFERVDASDPVRALVSTPPQHGKSLACLHALVWLLKRHPERRHAYVTYAQAFTQEQSAIAARIAQQHHLELDRCTLNQWTTPEGGGVTFTSRGGPLSGKPVDGVVIADDLLKDREEANSQLVRDKAMGWLSGVAFTRMHPGASVVIVATRWHLDDPIGRLIEAGGYEYIKLPAITDEGEALWPERRPLAWLRQQQAHVLPADWSAMYLCEPIADGARVFGPSAYYDAAPPGRDAHGFDAAYTRSTSSDWTVTLSGRRSGDQLFITNMLRRRVPAEQYANEYVPLMLAAGAREVTFFGTAPERGISSLLSAHGVTVNFETATTDKLARAIPVATAWNRGEVLLPRDAPWVPQFEAEVSTFTGHADAHDDIVDALAALHHALFARATVRIRRL